MRMDDPIPQYTHFVRALAAAHPDLAYIHLVEPRVDGNVDIPGGAPPGESNDFLRALWAPRPLVSAGGYGRDIALEVAQEKGDLIAFGRHYIANVSRRFVFCAGGERAAHGLGGSLIGGYH
jgi:NADPH2 dehydrogenase